MNAPMTRHPIPEWVTRGKTIRQLIAELQSFDDLDAEVRISVDYGGTNWCISVVERHGQYCVLVYAEEYHNNPGQAKASTSGR